MTETKTADSKAAEIKAAEPKAAETKVTETKTADSKAAETVIVALNDVNDRVYVLKDGRRVTLRCGTSHLRGKKSAALPVGAFGMTRIAKADWEEIKKSYGQTKIFKAEMIFASDSQAAAAKESEEKRELTHGLEGVDTTKTLTKPDKEGNKAKKGKAEA